MTVTMILTLVASSGIAILSGVVRVSGVGGNRRIGWDVISNQTTKDRTGREERLAAPAGRSGAAAPHIRATPSSIVGTDGPLDSLPPPPEFVFFMHVPKAGGRTMLDRLSLWLASAPTLPPGGNCGVPKVGLGKDFTGRFLPSAMAALADPACGAVGPEIRHPDIVRTQAAWGRHRRRQEQARHRGGDDRGTDTGTATHDDDDSGAGLDDDHEDDNDIDDTGRWWYVFSLFRSPIDRYLSAVKHNMRRGRCRIIQPSPSSSSSTTFSSRPRWGGLAGRAQRTSGSRAQRISSSSNNNSSNRAAAAAPAGKARKATPLELRTAVLSTIWGGGCQKSPGPTTSSPISNRQVAWYSDFSNGNDVRNRTDLRDGYAGAEETAYGMPKSRGRRTMTEHQQQEQQQEQPRPDLLRLLDPFHFVGITSHMDANFCLLAMDLSRLGYHRGMTGGADGKGWDLSEICSVPSEIWIGSTREAEGKVRLPLGGTSTGTDGGGGTITPKQVALLLTDHVREDVTVYVEVLRRYRGRLVQAISTVKELLLAGNSNNNNDRDVRHLETTLEVVEVELRLWSEIESLLVAGESETGDYDSVPGKVRSKNRPSDDLVRFLTHNTTTTERELLVPDLVWKQ